jgi:tRNA(Arg) A34 adenosine deaminase TadA
MKDIDRTLLEAAIEQSRVAARRGEYPYGAVITHRIDVRGPFLEEFAAKVLKDFWREQLKKSAVSFGLSL